MITHEPSFWLLTIIVSNQFPRPVTGAPSYGRICCEVYEAELDEEAAVVPVPVSGKHDVDFTMKDGNLGFHGISWDFMGFNEASISSEYIIYNTTLPTIKMYGMQKETLNSWDIFP